MTKATGYDNNKFYGVMEAAASLGLSSRLPYADQLPGFGLLLA
jgi:hypothetical protein